MTRPTGRDGRTDGSVAPPRTARELRAARAARQAEQTSQPQDTREPQDARAPQDAREPQDARAPQDDVRASRPPTREQRGPRQTRETRETREQPLVPSGPPEEPTDRDDRAEDDEQVVAPVRTGRLDMLYRGNGGLDVIGRSTSWYLLFGALVVVCLLSMVLRGFNFSIDFEGGSTVQFPARGAAGVADTGQVADTFARAVGHPAESVQIAGTGDRATVLIRSARLDPAPVSALRQALFDRFQPIGLGGRPDPSAVTDSAVSASWGGEITNSALVALAVFLALVAAYLAFYFEWRMAVAALIALVNDIVVTAGVYSIVGFEVSPATVIGLLTILGFSLYDTVVVFDKVRENTRGLLSRTSRTYAEAANLAVNQTLMRSLNTSLIAALPLIGLFVVGVILLGVGVLGDLALVQLVGTIIGAASSILLATPIVVDLAMRDRKWAAQAQKVRARRDRTRRPGDAPSSTDALGAAPSSAATRHDAPVPGTAPRPGARPATKSGRPSGKRRH